MTVTSYVASVAVLACACTSEPAAIAADPPAATVAGHYCHVGALTKDEWARLKALVPQLVAATFAREELPDGYAFKVHGSFKELGEWLDAVRRCCPSISYHLDLAPDLGDATLRIVGTNDAKAFIREEFKVLL